MNGLRFGSDCKEKFVDFEIHKNQEGPFIFIFRDMFMMCFPLWIDRGAM